MDERVRRTLDTYEANAGQYATIHDDRDVIADQVGEFLDALGESSRRVLDVGCGPGWESATFAEAGHEVVPFDLTPEFLDRTRERAPDSHVVRGDMRRLPFADDTFDGLWACASLLHVPQDHVGSALAGFERVLRPGGVVLASVQRPGGRSDGTSPYDDDRRYFELYEPAATETLFADAGFVDVDVRASPDDPWIEIVARKDG
jgi:SAM-dependent methyltransferase